MRYGERAELGALMGAARDSQKTRLVYSYPGFIKRRHDPLGSDRGVPPCSQEGAEGGGRQRNASKG